MYHLIKKGKGHFSINLYRGELQGDTREGFGLQLFPNGCYYIGFWRKNEAVGVGRLALPDGTYYEGQYYKNIIQTGRIRFFNGAEYEGTFDGTVYERFNKGTFKFTKGDKLTGEWRDGLLVDGQLIDAKGGVIEPQKDGTIVKRDVSADHYGIIITRTNKWMYEGGIVHNKCNGKGIIYCTFQQYKHGFFKNDTINGYYKKVGLNWGEIMEGECMNDKKIGTWKKLINKGYLIEKDSDEPTCRITFPFMNEDYFEGEIDNAQNEKRPYYVKIKKGIYHLQCKDGEYKPIQVSDIDNIMSIKEVKIRGLRFEFTFGKIFDNKELPNKRLRLYIKKLIDKGLLKEKHLVGFLRRIYRPEDASIGDSVYTTPKSVPRNKAKPVARSKSPINTYANKMQKLKKSTNIESKRATPVNSNTRIFPNVPSKRRSEITDSKNKPPPLAKDISLTEVRPDNSSNLRTSIQTNKASRKEMVKKSLTQDPDVEKSLYMPLKAYNTENRDSDAMAHLKLFAKNANPPVEENVENESHSNMATKTVVEPPIEPQSTYEMSLQDAPLNDEPRITSSFTVNFEPVKSDNELNSPIIAKLKESNEMVDSPLYKPQREEVEEDKLKLEPVVKKTYEVEYFEGCLQKGRMTGFCKASYADKSYKEGIFKDDKLNGPGTYILANGVELHSTYHDDVPYGPGIIIASKKIYKGEFEGVSFDNPFITLNKNYSIVVGEEEKLKGRVEGRCTIYLAHEFRMEAKLKNEQFIVNERCRLYEGDKRYWIGKIREENGNKVFDSLSSPKVKFLITENDEGILIQEMKL